MKQGDMPDIDTVGARMGTFSVLQEFAADDAQSTARRIRHRKNTVLVVDEAAVLDGQVFPFRTNSRSIAFGNPRTREGNAADGYVIADGYEEPLALANRVGDDDAGGLGNDRHAIGVPHRAIVVLAGFDLDGIARGSRLCRLARYSVFVIGPNLQGVRPSGNAHRQIQ